MSVVLNSGHKIPAIGYGVGTAWFGRTGIDAELRDAVLNALKVGHTHLDLAEMYSNEETMGAVFKTMPNKREDLFITEKILDGMPDIRSTLRKQLEIVGSNDRALLSPVVSTADMYALDVTFEKLGLDYVDLYLLHAPEKRFPNGSPTLQEAWAQMEELQDQGLALSIGVSNHRVVDLQQILQTCRIKPALNQIELQPYIYNEAKEIVDYCHENGIKIAAYAPTSPLVAFPGGPVDAVVEMIGKSTGMSPLQVLLKWAKQIGDIVITTSSKESRMKEQVDILTLPDLSEEEVKAITCAGYEKPSQRKCMQDVFED